MSDSYHTQNAAGMLRHAPVMFAILATLALLSAIWIRSPLAYLAASVVAGSVWLALLACAWRLRSDIATIACTVIVITAHNLLRARLVPDSLFTQIQGVLLSGASLMLVLWLFRGRITRFCRLTHHE